MKKQVKKLSLITNKIVSLSTRQLVGVQGGGPVDTSMSRTCPPSQGCSRGCSGSVYTAFGYASGKC